MKECDFDKGADAVTLIDYGNTYYDRGTVGFSTFKTIFERRTRIKILKEKGYILDYKFDEDSKQGLIKIALKYHPVTKAPAIRNLTRISKPGLRKYAGVDVMPRVLNGLGIAILSTSKGVMTDKEAKVEKVGGEVLCYVY